ncbi:MAG: helix-turn-helix transcriptional regulator [Muribaculaceae bacterium]|nr:helix-turn-helix transcriptional regulator [Muribaculaceae bacterium]
MKSSEILFKRNVRIFLNHFQILYFLAKETRQHCKAAPMLEWLGNKWALVVLVKISENEPVRFNELYRNIPSVSGKVLSQVLRQLTTDGIISRELFPDVPPRTEYSVTEFGRTLLPHVEALLNWGRDNFEQIMMNRQNVK